MECGNTRRWRDLLESSYKVVSWDAWVAQSIKHLPSAQGVIPGYWDRAPHRAPCSAGLLLPLPLPAAPPAVLSLSLSNK